jgi:hypothetical protein
VGLSKVKRSADSGGHVASLERRGSARCFGIQLQRLGGLSFALWARVTPRRYTDTAAGTMQLLALWIACAAAAAAAAAAPAPLLRGPPSAPLPLGHPALARASEAGPHDPEQLALTFAGADGALAATWVTWPQDDAPLFARAKAAAAGAWRAASRRLKLADAEPEGALALGALGRHATRDAHCRALRALGLRPAARWGLSPRALDRAAPGGFECYSEDGGAGYRSGALHHAVIDVEAARAEFDAAAAAANGAAPQKIYYQVGDEDLDVWSPVQSFAPPPAPGARAGLPLTLGLVGDLGQTADSAATLEHLAATAPAAALLVGDLSYADGEQPRWDSWGRLLAARGPGAALPWAFVEGNHEDESRDCALPPFAAYTARFAPRALVAAGRRASPLYHSFDVGGAHIVLLGSYADFDEGSAQAEWLADDLGAVDRARTPWVLVGMHVPWYNSNLAHGGEGDAIRDALERTLYNHGVDAVFAGHVHAYERSHRVYRGERDECAPMHVTIGDGGNREGLAAEYGRQPGWSAYREASFGHAALEMLNATHARFSWHRNQDGARAAGDEAWVVRGDERCAGRRRAA